MLKMFIDDEEVVSKNNFTIKEEMQNASSTILNNTYPKTWEENKDYISNFYMPKDFSKLDIQKFTLVQEAEAGTTVQINGSATLNDVDVSKNSKVLRLLGQTSQTGTPTPSSPIPINVVSGDNSINVCGKNICSSSSKVSATTIEFICGKNIAKTFALSFDTNVTLYVNTVYFVIDGVQNNVGTISGSGRVSAVITLSDAIYEAIQNATTFSIRVYKSGVVFNAPENAQIENNNQATNYEPYVGSSYPIYLGVENLIQLNEINLSANTTTDLQLGANLPIGTYNFNGENIIGDGRFNLYGVDLNDTQDYLLTNELTKNIGGGYSFTTTKIYKSVKIYTNVALSGKVQLEKGSKANHYTPYGTTPIELCKIGNYQDSIYKGVGSNLFSSAMELGALNNSTGENTPNNDCIRTQDYIAVEPNTVYTISNNMSYHIYTYEYGSDYSFIQYTGAGTSAYQSRVTITTSSTTHYIKVRTIASTIENNISSLWQLELGDIVNPVYEPYNSKDKWLLHKEIGKVVFDGSENDWVYQSAYTRFYKPFKLAKTNENIYSNYYIRGDTATNNYVMSISASYLYLRDERYTTTGDYKTWLGTHNLIIYYVLATPTTTEITDTTLISQLDDLESS